MAHKKHPTMTEAADRMHPVAKKALGGTADADNAAVEQMKPAVNYLKTASALKRGR